MRLHSSPSKAGEHLGEVLVPQRPRLGVPIERQAQLHEGVVELAVPGRWPPLLRQAHPRLRTVRR
eukprot:1127496-Heterocapsa_arctica.AAC.1